jgi:flagellar FliJ protein
MKSRETLIRLKKFQVDEKRRKVAQIEAMIAEFERIAGDLDREIKTEQERAGIHDPAHFAYPTYAKAAIVRRENLKRSADELKVQVDDAKAALGEAFEELKKVEMLDERDQQREKAEANAREQSELDREIKLEQDRAGIHDPAHFAYPTYAKAANTRRENLKRSTGELRAQLDDAQAALGEAFEELKKVELLDERDQARERAEENAREQADLDSIGLMRSRIGAVA